MAYQIQVKREKQAGNYMWVPVGWSVGLPYSYKTKREAYSVMRICYPNQTSAVEVRVIEIK